MFVSMFVRFLVERYTLKLGMEPKYGIGIATLKLGMEYGIRNRNTKTRNGMEFPEHHGIILNRQYMIYIQIRRV